MRNRWKLGVAVLLTSGAAAILAATSFAQPTISITSVRAQVVRDPGSIISQITEGPMGAGYDIRIRADVSETTWSATRWTYGGISHCVNHDNVSAGTGREVVLPYAFQRIAALRESKALPSTGVGTQEHVFSPPPGDWVLTIEAFSTSDCTGAARGSRPTTLKTTTPRANPPLVAACQGLQVSVVLDESGSIASAGATQRVRDATKALAEGLVGTGASMAVFKFSTEASSSKISPYKPVTQSFIDTTLQTYLNNYDPDGYTNWDDGLRVALTTDRPDLVIFLTDGNPNRYGNGGDTGIQEGYETAMTPAAAAADLFKASAHMFVIGVGDGVTDPLSAIRLQAVSGDKSFPTYPLSIADYTLVTDFTELEEALRNIASNLCNVTVTVTKETDDTGRDAWTSKATWGFTGRVQLQTPTPPSDYTWYEPPPSAPGSNVPRAGQTGANGKLRFVWRPLSATALSDITITEPSVPAAYTPESVTCTSAGQTILSSSNPATVASFTLQGLKVRDDVNCIVRNRLKRSTVQVVKNWDGAPSTTTIYVDATGASPYDASATSQDDGTSTSFAYPVSTSVRVGETPVPAGYTATIQCGLASPVPYTGGPYAVTSPATDGATLTCTITNKQLRSHVEVVKRWVGAAGSTTIYVDADGSAPYDASTLATTNGANALFTYPVSRGVFVGETPIPAGYTATIDCGGGPVPYTGGPFAVTSPATDGATRTCTITNTQQLSHVRVVKNWVGASASATIFVDADGAPPYDASTVAMQDGDSAFFTYGVSTGVFVGETAVPGGYTATIQCGQGSPQPYTGGPFPVTSPAAHGETLICTITNTQQLSHVRVVKNWLGAEASATIFVDADGSSPYDASTVADEDGDNVSFTYPVSTGVFVGETVVPAGYTATIQCGQASPQPYTGGAFPVTSPAVAGETISCTINNELLPPPVSTVQVVKDWVGPPTSATIYVDLDGVAPYDDSAVSTAGGESASFDYTPGTPVFVGETAIPSGYAATIDCGTGPQPYPGGPFPVTAPATANSTLTCTITNAVRLSHVRVVKNWVGAAASATIFVDADGAPPYDASTVAIQDGDSAFFTYGVSTGVFVGETAVPGGYAATIQCGQGSPVPYTGGPFPVTSPAVHGETLICTITNTQQLSTVRVVKNWVGAAASATIFVDADGAPPYDASTVADEDGDNASFTYPVSTGVFVGETAVPAGYTATIDCGGGPQPYTGGPYAVTSPAVDSEILTCTITNTQLLSTVQVVKDWEGGASSTTIFVDQNGSAPFDAATVATTSGASASFTYPVSTPVTLGETPVPPGFSATIDCGSGPQVYSGGPVAVTSPALDGGTLTCTITNSAPTTVRVVKSWAGPPASTTIFVDGSGQSPYDVSTLAEIDGESASFDYPVSTLVTLGEIAVPEGYVAFINCGTGPETLHRYTGGPFTVMTPSTPGAVLTCTVHNAKRLALRGRLVITKKANRKQIRGAGQVEFTLTVRNKGRGVARSVRVCDRLPAGMELVRAPGARRTNGQLCWEIAALQPGARKRFYVVVRVDAVTRRTVFLNTADVSGTNTITCQRPISSKRQRRVCNAAARVVALPRLFGVRSVRVTFTG